MLSRMVPGMIQEFWGEKEMRPLCLILPSVGTSSPRIIMSRELWNKRVHSFSENTNVFFRNNSGQQCIWERPAHLSCTGGSSHCQHSSLLQIQADVFENRCDVQVGEEEPGVVAHVSVRLVLLLDLLKQFTYSLKFTCLYRARRSCDQRLRDTSLERCQQQQIHQRNTLTVPV